jgi:plastocyanin
MNTKQTRPRVSGLGWVLITILLGISGTAVLVGLRIHSAVGELPPPVVLFLVMPVLTAAAVARGWRWVPAFVAALSALLLVMLAPHLPRVLAVPGDMLFTPFVLLTALGAAGTAAGTLTALQRYRSPAEQPRMPRWMPAKLAALGGGVAGVMLMASLPQQGATAGISPEQLEQLPAIETERFEFVQPELRVRAGETVALRLVNRDAATHSFDIDEFDVHALMPAHATAITVFKADRPGTYTFYCAPHYDRKSGKGMKGTLIVEP